MTTDRRTFIGTITPYLDWTERIFVAGLSIGLMIKYLSINNSIAVLQISILGLALTYFLSAFKVIEIPYEENEVMEFKDLLALTITPKVLWISSAISLFGIFVMYQNLGNDGYKQSFMVGTLSILMCLFIHIYAMMSGTKYLKYVRHIFFRAIPILLLNIYILFGK